MSGHVARRGLKHIIISAGVTIIIGGAVAVPIVVLPIASAHTTASTPGASSASTPTPTPTSTSGPDENNWG
jgi:hypothetical protein